MDVKRHVPDYVRHRVLVGAVDPAQMHVLKHVPLAVPILAPVDVLEHAQQAVDQMDVLDLVHKIALVHALVIVRAVVTAAVMIVMIAAADHVLVVVVVDAKVIVKLLVHGAVDQMDVQVHVLGVAAKIVVVARVKEHAVKIVLDSAPIIPDTKWRICI